MIFWASKKEQGQLSYEGSWSSSSLMILIAKYGQDAKDNKKIDPKRTTKEQAK